MTKKDQKPILTIENLDVDYRVERQNVAALRDIEISISKGARVGLVGESGCGKSTLLKTIMGVLPANAEIRKGKVDLNGSNLLSMDTEERRKTRWADISMITQSALNALNPVHKIGAQIVEAIQAHSNQTTEQARAHAAKLFEMVGVPPGRLDDYPHQFSGGMRQRAVIAMALALRPEVILADEPTTALDVIVQDQIFERLFELQDQQGFALVLVTHDLALVVESCETIVVMYAGVIVEMGPTHQIARSPQHPYSAGLRYAIPDPTADREPISIPGSPPDLSVGAKGCRFAERCPLAIEKCVEQSPELKSTNNDGHKVRCHRSDEMPNHLEQFQHQAFWRNTAS